MIRRRWWLSSHRLVWCKCERQVELLDCSGDVQRPEAPMHGFLCDECNPYRHIPQIAHMGW